MTEQTEVVPEVIPASEPEIPLDEIIVQEIFALHDFRDWWRGVNSLNPNQFRYKMARNEWEAAVRAYKKLKAQSGVKI